MMQYKGYVAKVDFDDEAGVLHGRILNIRDVISFEAESVHELRKEFAASVDDYLAMCAEAGEEPEKPYSGRFVVRIEPDLHRRAAIAAEHAGQSLNAWVATTLEASLTPHVYMAPKHTHVSMGPLKMQRSVTVPLETKGYVAVLVDRPKTHMVHEAMVPYSTNRFFYGG